MEALMLLFNSIAVIVMVYMGLRDDRAPPEAPQTSVFRMADDAPPAATIATKTGRSRSADRLSR